MPTLISASLTDTASGAGSKLLDLLVGGTTRFSVAKTGAVLSASGLTLDYETTATTSAGLTLYQGDGTNPRTTTWTMGSSVGVLTFTRAGDSAATLSLFGSGVVSLTSSQPRLYFNGPGVDWTLRVNSDRLRVLSGPAGSEVERANFATNAFTLYTPLVLTADVGSSLIPTATDTYNLGSAARLWNEGFISQLNAVVFAEQTLTLLGGWFSVSPDQGTIAADVSTGATSINFGKAMTVGHFVEIRGYDTGGVLRAEYLQVGSLVSGTTYNVTRGLNGTSAAWASGTPFRVNGTSGSGRVELNAFDTPRISLLLQGATYNAQTETVRIGDLNGMPGVASTQYGVYLGDATQYLKYTGGVLTIAGNGSGLTSISGGNIQTGTVTATQLSVSTLSAISANLGTVTAGTITGVSISVAGGLTTLNAQGLSLREATTASSSLDDWFTVDLDGGYGGMTVQGTLVEGSGIAWRDSGGTIRGFGQLTQYTAGGATHRGLEVIVPSVSGQLTAVGLRAQGTTSASLVLRGTSHGSYDAKVRIAAGLSSVSVNSGGDVSLHADGSTILVRKGGNNNSEIYVPGRAGQTGSNVGSVVFVDRSTGTNNTPGMFLAIGASGGFYFLWPDNSGIWRTASSAPEADGSPAHDSGTVVGSQTSHRAAKESIRDWIDYDVSLALIRATPLYQFRYKDGRFQRQWFTGLITDTAPAAFGMDEGRALNEVSAIGHLFGAVRALADRVDAAERRADAAEARVDALTQRIAAIEAQMRYTGGE